MDTGNDSDPCEQSMAAYYRSLAGECDGRQTLIDRIRDYESSYWFSIREVLVVAEAWNVDLGLKEDDFDLDENVYEVLTVADCVARALGYTGETPTGNDSRRYAKEAELLAKFLSEYIAGSTR